MLSIAALLLAASSTQLPADTIYRNGFEFDDPNCQAPPLTRMANADIIYPSTGNSRRWGVDLRQYENIWGHANNSDTPVLWPGRSGATPAILKFWKNQFVAARFTVPQDAVPQTYLRVGYSTYYSGPLLDLSVSQNCGDFAPANPTCLTTGASGGQFFKKIVIAPAVDGCPLTPGQTYFINIRMNNPTPQACSNKAYCDIATNIQAYPPL